MQSVFHVPVSVLNDANAAILGECFIGCGKNVKNTLMITLGTGVGGGILINGKVYNGSRGLAGEIGQVTLYGNGKESSYGKKGCFENYASTTALVNLAEDLCHAKHLNGRLIFQRALAGDDAMKDVIHRWVIDIAEGISGFIHIFNPEMVIIGGGVSAQEELLLLPLKKEITCRTMPRFAENLQIVRAELGNLAGVVGSAKFWIDENQRC